MGIAITFNFTKVLENNIAISRKITEMVKKASFVEPL